MNARKPFSIEASDVCENLSRAIAAADPNDKRFLDALKQAYEVASYAGWRYSYGALKDIAAATPFEREIYNVMLGRFA